MKISTIYSEDSKIEFFNNFFGKETIKVNGEIVSEKYSMGGSTHYFKLLEEKREIDCRIEIKLATYGVGVDFYRDSKPVVVTNSSGQRVMMFLVIFFVVIGYNLFVDYLF